MNIIRHNWQPSFPNQIEIIENEFTITFTQKGDVEIECNWDYGYGGRGTERMCIPLKVLKEIIEEIEK